MRLSLAGTSRVRFAGRHALRRAFEACQRLGVDVLPRHFYSSIPDIRALRAEHRWRAPYSMAGLSDASIEAQVAFVRACCPRETVERLGAGTAIYDESCKDNGANGYGPLEGLFLFCFVSTNRPAKIVQVGAGVSTSMILRAAQFAGYRPHIECVDPYPTAMLQKLSASGAIKLVVRPAQDVELDELTDLRAGDLLFVDSTHTVKPGSEVNRLILEVLPRLASGVFAHFHDVLFPYDYYPTVLSEDLFFWNESVLLHAFLCGNSAWRLRASLSMLHHLAPNELRTVLPAYRPARFDDGIIRSRADGRHFPSAAYLQRLG